MVHGMGPRDPVGSHLEIVDQNQSQKPILAAHDIGDTAPGSAPEMPQFDVKSKLNTQFENLHSKINTLKNPQDLEALKKHVTNSFIAQDQGFLKNIWNALKQTFSSNYRSYRNDVTNKYTNLISKISDRVSQLQISAAKSIKPNQEHLARLSELETKYQDLLQQHDSLKRKNASLKEPHAKTPISLKDQITLEKKLEAKSQSLQNAQAGNAKRDAAVIELQGQILDLETQSANLQKELTNSKRTSQIDATKLQKENEGLRIELIDYQKEHPELFNQNQELKKQTKELQGKLEVQAQMHTEELADSEKLGMQKAMEAIQEQAPELYQQVLDALAQSQQKLES